MLARLQVGSGGVGGGQVAISGIGDDTVVPGGRVGDVSSVTAVRRREQNRINVI